jgi:hypothetical protein
VNVLSGGDVGVRLANEMKKTLGSLSYGSLAVLVVAAAYAHHFHNSVRASHHLPLPLHRTTITPRSRSKVLVHKALVTALLGCLLEHKLMN